MGITDRKYMSEPGRSFGSIRGHDINAVILLILVNVSVWMVWQFANQSDSLGDVMSTHFMARPSGVLDHYHVHTLLTAAISHTDFYHLLFNMLFLWYLGRDVEVFYGRNNFVALYVFGGLVSSVAFCGLEFYRGVDNPMLGASGAIMGIAVAAAFIDPRKTIRIFFGMIPVQLWILVPIYILMDFSGLMNQGGRQHGFVNDNVAHAAHLGGALAGLLFYTLDLRVFASRGRQRSGLIHSVGQWWRARKFTVVEPRREVTRTERRERIPDEIELVAARKARATKTESAERKPKVEVLVKQIDIETAQRVDALLEKISREGIGALSPDERDFLKRSSEKYKR